MQELCHKELERSVSTHLAGEEPQSTFLSVFLPTETGHKCKEPFGSPVLVVFPANSSLHPHGSANMDKRQERQDGNEQFGHYKKITLGRGHFYLGNSWDRFINTKMISRTILLLHQPFHTGIWKSSGKLHLTQKAYQTPPSSCWRKRLRNNPSTWGRY